MVNDFFLSSALHIGPPSGGSYSSTGYGVSKGGAKTGGGGCGAASFGSSDRCPRCEKSVYAAEKVVGAGSVSDASELVLLISNSMHSSPPGHLRVVHLRVVRLFQIVHGEHYAFLLNYYMSKLLLFWSN